MRIVVLAILAMAFVCGCESPFADVDKSVTYNIGDDLALNQNNDGTQEVGNTTTESTSETEIEGSESATIN